MLRHNRMSLGTDSTLVRMVAPVVVKPESASKKASVKLGTLLLSKNGRPPNTDSITHDREMVMTPSRGWRRWPFHLRVEKTKINPVMAVIIAEKGILYTLMP